MRKPRAVMQRLGLATTVPAERLPAMERLVPRRALFDALASVKGGQVVLLCAPAGSGKTVLLRSWIGPSPRAIASPGCRSSAASGTRSASGCRSSTRWPARSPRTGWWSASARRPPSAARRSSSGCCPTSTALEEPVVLVIDDLHELRSAEALRLLERFLARLPPTLRVVLATREDPELGLHRLRLAGELIEIRGADLRFSLEETRELLEAAGDRALGRERWRCSTSAPRAGRPACGWRRSRSPGIPTPSASSASSPAASGPWRSTCWPRCWSASRPRCATCCCAPRSLERVSGPLADVLTGGSGSERILQELEEANAFVAVARRRADVVPLPPPVRRPAAARAAAARLRRAIGRCTGRRPSGTRSTATRSRRSATRRRRGDWPDAARLLADNYVEPRPRRPHGDAPRAAGGVPGARRRRATPSSRSPSRRCGSTTASSTTARAYIAVARAAGRTTSRPTAGGASSSSWRRSTLALARRRGDLPTVRRGDALGRGGAVRTGRRATASSATTCGPPR